MKLPRNVKGGDLVKALCRDWNYRIVHQEGSHVILETEVPFHRRPRPRRQKTESHAKTPRRQEKA
jgi:predicted RNA binding protein YcfA (HicA-like mRNA interferase family)